MSLFVCEECECVDNTATSHYWFRNHDDHDGRALCSACDPDIGQWHGRFPREKHDGTRTVINERDY